MDGLECETFDIDAEGFSFLRATTNPSRIESVAAVEVAGCLPCETFDIEAERFCFFRSATIFSCVLFDVVVDCDNGLDEGIGC